MKHVSCYVKGYPRPQFVRGNWTDLNGEWRFAFDDANVGERQGWYRDFKTDKTICVPFSYQTAASGIGDTGRHDNIWYSREVKFDKARLAAERLLLNFEGSDYITKIWVNGVFVGKHTGGYCRFSADITEAVLEGGDTAAIVVKCEDSYDATQPRGKQKWMDAPYGCWYMETNGIWKSVWTEYVSSRRIERVKMTPNRETYCMDLEVELTGTGADTTLTTEVYWEGRLIAANTTTVLRNKFSCAIDLANDYESFKVHWWSWDCPALYDVKFILKSGGVVTDEIGSYFGFRAFTANRDTLVLNNGPAYLRMALEQGYYRESGLTCPNEQAMIDELLLVKELGFNGVRVHQKIEDERFFYYADILGVATWVEMPSAYEFRDATVTSVTTEWMDVVRQYYDHPSVLAWVPINESWGVPRIMTDKREQWFTEALYYVTKAYDGMRPVISNDGWEHTTSDIITLHNYDQSPEGLAEFYRHLDKVLAGENLVDYTQWRLPFANGYGYRGQPVMITEFAGIGYETSGDKGWGYGDKVCGEKAFVERLAGLVKAVRTNHGICGFCVTQITDVEAEINGLCDADRRPKADKELLAKAIRQ